MTEQENNPPKYKIDIVEMWGLSKGDSNSDNWGIEGYESPRKSFNCIKSKKEKHIEEQIRRNKLPQGPWPPKLKKDGNDQLIWPQRTSFIDEVIYLICYLYFRLKN